MARQKKKNILLNNNSGTANIAPSQETINKLISEQLNPVIANDSLSNVQIKDVTPRGSNFTPTPTELTNPEVFRDSKTGEPSGVTLPNGKTFLGVNSEEIQGIADNFALRTKLPEGTSEVGTAQALADRQNQIKRLLGLAQQGLLTPAELENIAGADLDLKQALGAGVIGVAPGLIGGAATGAGLSLLAGASAGAAAGAAAGGFVTPVAVALAALGAVGGFLAAVRSNIKGQQSGEFAADQSALKKGETMLRSLITDTNQNPQNAAENIALFYQTLNLIDSAHMKTFKDSQENLNRFLGNDGTPQLAKFDAFDNTMRTYYVNQFLQAVNNPDPSKMLLTTEDLSIDFSNEEE